MERVDFSHALTGECVEGVYAVDSGYSMKHVSRCRWIMFSYLPLHQTLEK